MKILCSISSDPRKDGLVELILQVGVEQLTEQQKETLVRQLAVLLNVLDSDVKVLKIQAHTDVRYEAACPACGSTQVSKPYPAQGLTWCQACCRPALLSPGPTSSLLSSLFTFYYIHIPQLFYFKRRIRISHSRPFPQVLAKAGWLRVL